MTLFKKYSRKLKAMEKILLNMEIRQDSFLRTREKLYPILYLKE